jgi:hypothetical protein
MEKNRIHAKFCSENLKKRDNLEELSMDRRIVLKQILNILM